MTREKLVEVLADHERWLETGGKRGSRASLIRENLSGYDLRGVNLEDAYLFNSNLEGADLRGAKLGGANLSEARLTRARLNQADIRNASLRMADLTDAQLVGARICGANFGGACLTGTIMHFARGKARGIGRERRAHMAIYDEYFNVFCSHFRASDDLHGHSRQADGEGVRHIVEKFNLSGDQAAAIVQEGGHLRNLVDKWEFKRDSVRMARVLGVWSLFLACLPFFYGHSHFCIYWRDKPFNEMLMILHDPGYLAFVLFSLFHILVGYGLLARRSWGRKMGLVVSFTSLFLIPIGTVIGILGLNTLGREARDCFGPYAWRWRTICLHTRLSDKRY